MKEKNEHKKRNFSIKKAYTRFLISMVAGVTDAALFVMNKKFNNINSNNILNLSYGKSKFHKYNLFFPNSIIDKPMPEQKIEKNNPSAHLKKLLQLYEKTKNKVKNFTSQKTVFYFHGGSFCGGDKKYNGYFCQKFAEEGYIVININYRLLPKVYIDDCYADCVKAVKHTIESLSFVNKKNIYFCGDSAGGAIAAYLAARHTSGDEIIDKDLKIKAVGLFYGVFDFMQTKSFVNTYLQRVFKYQYGKEESLENMSKEYSAITFVTKNFPPAFITSGDVDPLHNQSILLKDKLEDLGVEHKILFFRKSERKDGFHGFLNAVKTKSFAESFESAKNFFER